MKIPRNIPQQIEIVKQAKAGNADAIAAIGALAEGSWMRAALVNPNWPKHPDWPD